MNPVTLLLCLSLALVSFSAPLDTRPKKYAPKYCLRMRFNCDVQAGHVCCRFPLPPDDYDPNTARQKGSIGVKFRPIILPSRRTETKEKQDNQDNGQKETSKSNDQDSSDAGVKDGSKRKSSILALRRKPSFNKNVLEKTIVETKKSTSNPSTEVTQTTEKKKKNPSLSLFRRRPSLRGNKPRLCMRLVVDCETNPFHMCCQYDDDASTTTASTTITTTTPFTTTTTLTATETTSSSTTVSTTSVTPSSTTINTSSLTSSSAPTSSELTTPFSLMLHQGAKPETSRKPLVTTSVIPFIPFANQPQLQSPALQTPTLPPIESSSIARITTTTSPAELSTISEDGWVATIEEVKLTPVQEEPTLDKPDEPEEMIIPYQPEVEPLLEVPDVSVVHQKIPGECFTLEYDCETDPSFVCCQFL